MKKSRVGRREFMMAAGASAAALGTNSSLGAQQEKGRKRQDPPLAPETKYPKLAIITNYSRQKLAFATQVGYEGVVVKTGKDFNPYLSDSQIDQILATSRETGCRIISVECFYDGEGKGINHIAPDPAERRSMNERFIHCLEFAHRLGCKFVGSFSGGIPDANFDRQAKELAEVFNEKYLPVCQKYDVSMGWENYPTAINFATVPAAWEKVFSLITDRHFGMEFDPSHLVRQYIDPYQAAWDIRDRILAIHLKDTEITQPVLQQVGIHGDGWWRYRIPGQGLIDWPRFFTVLLQAGFNGGAAVEHEDRFWDAPPSDSAADFPQERKDGFILAYRFLRQYLPGRLS
ncbi:MAG TPA: sugar phosphate isomerase/epimerase [Terriglobia bacterium]|jgi:sugar phosphate isomerase/epimerase|nr:sugar phosphate isomerase/epimerase [Terriglobia bacterium]